MPTKYSYIKYPWGDPLASNAEADHINLANCLWMENDVGATISSGYVGFVEADGKVGASTERGQRGLAVVVALNPDSTGQDIAAGAFGWFQFLGPCPWVYLSATSAIGDWLILSTTAGRAEPITSGVPPVGAFARALSVGGVATGCTAVLTPQLAFASGLLRSDADVTNPPTLAELIAAFDTAANVGDGFLALLDDGGAGANVYLVGSDGANWWYAALTKAT